MEPRKYAWQILHAEIRRRVAEHYEADGLHSEHWRD
jgi:hypothetical protein